MQAHEHRCLAKGLGTSPLHRSPPIVPEGAILTLKSSILHNPGILAKKNHTSFFRVYSLKFISLGIRPYLYTVLYLMRTKLYSK